MGTSEQLSAALTASAEVMAASARVYAIVEAMKAANRERELCGYAQAYPEKAFLDLIEEQGIAYNQVVAKLRGG